MPSTACPPGVPDCGGVTRRLLASAARYFGVERTEVVVVSSEARRWPNSCLGCASPGQECQPVVTPGHRAVVGVAGNDRRLVYHTRRGTDEFVLCWSAEGQCPAGREVCGRVCCGAGDVCRDVIRDI